MVRRPDMSFVLLRRQARSTLFPYTTLFRSGFKGEVKEGGVREPFLMQWTGTLPAGKVYDQPVISLDIFPTALAAGKIDRKSTRLNSSHTVNSYAVFCLKKKRLNHLYQRSVI